jgi:hypothetical protein
MIKRFIATKDNTITNAFEANLVDRGKEANMGLSDILETFSIYAQASTSSMEASRILLQFPVDEIIEDRVLGLLPASGSVSFYLRLFNAPHAQTLPRNFVLAIKPVSSSWDEGTGLDMETYLDTGVSNWLSSSTGIGWTSEGGDYLAAPAYQYSQSFDLGNENINVDITNLVEDWMAGTIDNYGIGVMMSGAYEDGSLSASFYTKRFFARGTEFFFMRPVIEAQWNSAICDDRATFYASSSLAPVADNTNVIYLYNVVRGQMVNIPSVSTGSIYVDLYAELGGSPLNVSPITGGWVSEGIYSASVVLNTTASLIYDVWYKNEQYYTGSIEVNSFAGSAYSPNPQYVVNVTNLKSKYSRKEPNARFRLYVRQKSWSPTIYTVSSTDIETSIIEKVYYNVVRTKDDYEAVSYGTGSIEYTKLSYDTKGNYFDLDISLLEAGYSYAVNLLYNIAGYYYELSEVCRFRVEE